MTDGDPDTYNRRLTAYHESGHGIAAAMCGGSFLAISIEPDGNREGFTNIEVAAHNKAFVIYSGCWAEARAQWAGPLDGEDEDGYTFDDYVGRAFERNAEGDLREYRRATLADAAVYGDLSAYLTFSSEKAWSEELEARWPVIQHVAGLLISGSDVTADIVVGLLR